MMREYVKDFSALAEYMLDIASNGKSIAAVLEAKETEELFASLQEFICTEYGLIDLIGSECDPSYREYYTIVTPDGGQYFIDICPVHLDHDNRESINNSCADVLVFHYHADTEILDANDTDEYHVFVMRDDDGVYIYEDSVYQQNNQYEPVGTCSESITTEESFRDFGNLELKMRDCIEYMLNQFRDYLTE